MFPEFEKNRSMIFNPLIVVASELGIGRPTARPRSDAERQSSLVRAYRRVTSSELGSVIVDAVDDDAAELGTRHAPIGAYERGLAFGVGTGPGRGPADAELRSDHNQWVEDHGTVFFKFWKHGTGTRNRLLQLAKGRRMPPLLDRCMR